MTQVVIPTNLGGSGIAYSDDGTGARDFRNGGHRPWLLPMVGEQIAAAQTAVTAAASTVGAASTQASSTTSLTIGTGTQNLTVETGKNIIPGMPVRIASTATPSNRMDGTVTSYNAGTGALVVSVDRVNGSGSESSWRVFLTGAGISTAELLEAEFGGTGPTITTATALTSTTARVRPVAMTANNQAVTLPDATTLQLGGPQVILPNTGTRLVPVRDTAGALITVIEPGGVAELHLLSQASSAGAWVATGRGLLSALPVVDLTWEAAYTQVVEVACRLSDAISLHFARNASGHPFVRAVNHVTGSIGGAALISAVNQTVTQVFRISDTKAFVVIDGTGSNVFNVAVDAVTLACTPSSSASAAVFDKASFNGEDSFLIAQLGANNDLFAAIDVSGGAVRAQAVDCSGTNPSAGSATNIVGSGGQGDLACFRVSNTTALAIYADDSGSAGTPHSLRAVVLSFSGTSITVNTTAGVNDVLGQTGSLPVVQLTATSYVVAYGNSSNSRPRVVHIGVSGTSVTFGSPYEVEAVALSTAANYSFGSGNAGKINPNLFRLSDTTALLTVSNDTSYLSRHVVISNNSGTLTGGTVLYGLWTDANGGNLPQASDAFLGCSTASGELTVFNVTISGTALAITGSFAAGDFAPSLGVPFGVSGGVRGVQQQTRPGTYHLLRAAANSQPRYLGTVTLNNWSGGGNVPVEVTSSKAAFHGTSLAQDASTTANVRTLILEFAA